VGGIPNPQPTWSINCSSWGHGNVEMAECAKLVKGFKAGNLNLSAPPKIGCGSG